MTENMLFSLGLRGHFALSTLPETRLKGSVSETNVKNNDITKNTNIPTFQNPKIPKCKM